MIVDTASFDKFANRCISSMSMVCLMYEVPSKFCWVVMDHKLIKVLSV